MLERNAPAALNAGIIVAAKANQNPPIRKYEKCDRDAAVYLSMSLNLPMVPKTTQGKVLPSINSRILVISSNKPPRKTIGPLFPVLRLTVMVMLTECLLHESHPVSTGASPGHQTTRNWSRSNYKSTESSEMSKTVRPVSTVWPIADEAHFQILTVVSGFQLAWQDQADDGS